MGGYEKKMVDVLAQISFLVRHLIILPDYRSMPACGYKRVAVLTWET